MLAGLRRSSTSATAAFEAYDYTTALEATERFFWTFCDDYLELVKERAYGGRGDAAAASAKAALALALSSAAAAARAVPAVRDRGGLVVVAGRLDPPASVADAVTSSPAAGDADPAMLDAVAAALAGLRGAKSTAKVSMRTEVTDVVVTADESLLALLAQAADDLAAAAKIIGGAAYLPSAAGSLGTVVDVRAQIVRPDDA